MCKFRIWLRLIITSTILYHFWPNFACDSQMCSLPRLLFERQTGSSLPILEVWGFRFWQFSGSGDHIFQQMSSKFHAQIKFGNADFVFNGEWNRKYKSDVRDVQIPVWIRLGITSIILHRFSPNFAIGSGISSHRRLFVTQTGSSLLIFRGVRILISAVFRLWWAHFSTDEQQIPCTDKIRQCRLCIQWWMKPEI